MCRAVALAAQPERSRRDQAIRILEAMGDRQELAPEDRFLLASLYEGRAERPKARQQLLALATGPGATARHMAALARMLYRQGDPGEARPWLDRLDAIKDRPLPAVERAELEGRRLAAEGKGAEAARVLREATAQADPAGRRAVVAVLEELDLDAEAEALHRRAFEASGVPASTWPGSWPATARPTRRCGSATPPGATPPTRPSPGPA